jgi:hypothetical protein
MEREKNQNKMRSKHIMRIIENRIIKIKRNNSRNNTHNCIIASVQSKIIMALSGVVDSLLPVDEASYGARWVALVPVRT